MKHACVALLTIVLSANCVSTWAQVEPESSRTWTSLDGAHKIEGTLVAVKDGWIKLTKPDGTTATAQLSKLSQADRDFVAEWLKPKPGVIEGRVIRVVDGDTLHVLDAKKQSHKIRLQGIDAPEDGAPYSDKSKKALIAKVFKKNVRVEWKERDKYKRVLGHVHLDDNWINRDMIAEGYAWHYKKYSKDKRLAEAEKKSRSRRDGLWRDPNPIPPWDYRENPEKYARQLNRPDLIKPKIRPPPTEQPTVGRYWLNTNSNVRHNSGCRWHGKTDQGRWCGPREGKACGICGG